MKPGLGSVSQKTEINEQILALELDSNLTLFLPA